MDGLSRVVMKLKLKFNRFESPWQHDSIRIKQPTRI
jgi:hypothetical protein